MRADSTLVVLDPGSRALEAVVLSGLPTELWLNLLHPLLPNLRPPLLRRLHNRRSASSRQDAFFDPLWFLVRRISFGSFGLVFLRPSEPAGLTKHLDNICELTLHPLR